MSSVTEQIEQLQLRILELEKEKEKKEKGQKGAAYQAQTSPTLGPGEARRDGRLHQSRGPVRQGPDERYCWLNPPSPDGRSS